MMDIKLTNLFLRCIFLKLHLTIGIKNIPLVLFDINRTVLALAIVQHNLSLFGAYPSNKSKIKRHLRYKNARKISQSSHQQI